MTALNCPSCARPMTVSVDNTLAFDRCACGALWFDGHELDAYARRHAPARPQLEGQRRMLRSATTLSCPRCQRPTLQAFTLAGVPLHACTRCHGHLLADEAVLRAPDSATTSNSWVALDVFDWIAHVLLWAPWS